MLIPVRCFSCGSMISCKYVSFMKKVDEYRTEQQPDSSVLDFESLNKKLESDEVEPTPEFKAMADLKIHRMCCRRHMLCNVDLIDVI